MNFTRSADTVFCPLENFVWEVMLRISILLSRSKNITYYYAYLHLLLFILLPDAGPCIPFVMSNLRFSISMIICIFACLPTLFLVLEDSYLYFLNLLVKLKVLCLFLLLIRFLSTILFMNFPLLHAFTKNRQTQFCVCTSWQLLPTAVIHV